MNIYNINQHTNKHLRQHNEFMLILEVLHSKLIFIQFLIISFHTFIELNKLMKSYEIRDLMP